MSVTRRIAFGTVSGWISRCTNIGIGLILLPILFRSLSRDALGVWLLLGQTWAILGIFDLGFAATLTRRIAFAKGKSGPDPDTKLSRESLRDIADLIETSRKMFLFLALAAFIIAFAAGFFALPVLNLSAALLRTARIAWGLLCLTLAFSLRTSIWHSLLLGTGNVGWDSLTATVAKCLTVAAQIAVVLFGGGLIGLAVVAGLGALAERLAILVIARRMRPELGSLQGSWHPELLTSMAPVALKAWVTTIAGVVVTNSDQFFVAGLAGADHLPAYRAAYLIFANLLLISVTIAESSAVFIAQLWQAGNLDKVHRIVAQNLRLGLSIMVVGGASILALGERLFNVWLGPGNYIGAATAAIFFATICLETHSVIITTCSRATEDEAFAYWAAAAAALKVTLSLLLGAKLGLIGIALGTLLAQLVTTHWFMSYRGFRRLRMSVSMHLGRVVAPLLVLFVVTFGTIRTLTSTLSSYNDVVIVVLAVMTAGCLLAGGAWLLMLERPLQKVALVYSTRLLRNIP